jgi:DNA-binding MarR family transcriptional regulator
VEEHSFKEIAGKTGYTPMAITKAVENLTALKLIDVTGDKEKFIQFRLQGRELWQDAINRNILINPVRKRVYIDEKPTGIIMLHSNGSALPEYSDLDFSRQEFYAIDKNIYYNLQDKEEFINENDVEGRYCLEVWKYNPETLLGELPNENQVVDPLSLYLSMKDSRNERIEMALEQVFKKLIW